MLCRYFIVGGKMKKQFKGSLKRQFNQGTLGMSVHTGISYKRPKKNKPKTNKGVVFKLVFK